MLKHALFLFSFISISLLSNAQTAVQLPLLCNWNDTSIKANLSYSQNITMSGALNGKAFNMQQLALQKVFILLIFNNANKLLLNGELTMEIISSTEITKRLKTICMPFVMRDIVPCKYLITVICSTLSIWFMKVRLQN